MKSSSRIEGSICGAIFSFPTAKSRHALVAQQQEQLRRHSTLHKANHRRTGEQKSTICPSGSNKETPSFFSLARSLYASAFPQTYPSRGTRKRLNYSTASAVATPATAIFDTSFPAQSRNQHSSATQRTREALLALVDPADDDLTLDEHFNFLRDTYRSGYAQPEGDGVMVSERSHDTEYPPPSETPKGNEDVQGLVQTLRKCILLRLRRPNRHSAEDVYTLYRQLPTNPISYLSARLRHQLLQCLAITDKKDATSMLRYFAVVADVKDSGFTLTLSEWNNAMSFASRYVGTVTETEAEATLELWREMEQDAQIKANAVTFNILFDVASKAGNFTLAEMIYKEMEERGFTYNRYHHVSLIHFFGLKQDSGGVRAAYRNMVEAGELIDVVVLNAVIASFLRVGEESAAHQLYRRMRSLHTKASRLPVHTYTSNKMVTKVLMMFARVGRAHPAMAPSLQAQSPMTPDLNTYRMLIRHHAVQTGDVSAVVQYLDEMKFFDVDLHGSIFLVMFKGFATHGGGTGTGWSAQRLQSTFDALLQRIDEGATGLYIDTWLAIWALRAFDRCCSPETVFKAYNSLSLRWDLSEQQTEHMISILHSMLRNKAQHLDILKTLGRRKVG